MNQFSIIHFAQSCDIPCTLWVEKTHQILLDSNLINSACNKMALFMQTHYDHLIIKHHGILNQLQLHCLPQNCKLPTYKTRGYHSCIVATKLWWNDWTIKKHKTLHYWPYVRRIHQWLVDSPHKRPVIWKLFSCNDIIIQEPSLSRSIPSAEEWHSITL